MSIKRYIAEKDTTITDAFKQNQTERAKLSNMGASDTLEIFSIYAQVTNSSYEKSRLLIQFPISDIISDRNNKLIAQSGSCQFILKLSNATNTDSTPDNIVVSLAPISGTWQEGVGLDMEGYTDIGTANWINKTNTSTWFNEGGDTYSSSIDTLIVNATDDLEVDITNFVENWISGIVPNNGLLISLSSILEANTESYYVKKFFARRSQYFYKRPWIEARSNSSIKDRRNSFYLSNDLLPQEDNLNTLFLTNSVRGQLKNIPSISTGTLLVSLYSGTLNSGPKGIPLALLNGSVTSVTGGYYSTGIYTASVGISGTYEYLYDVWSTLSGIQLHTGSVISTKSYDSSEDGQIPEYVLSMPQLKQTYRSSDISRMRVEVKNKIWDSNIYHIAAYEPEIINIENLYYRIIRLADNYEVISYGTGTVKQTLTSYDSVGNYFDLDMGLFEPGFTYKLLFGFEYNNSFHEIKETFKFRVDK